MLFTTGGMHGHPSAYVVEQYPTPTPGFELDPDERVLRVGFRRKVLASKELLTLSPESGAIEREGKHVKVLRASIRNEGGNPLLIPEQENDTENALVYLDVGSGRYTFIRIQSENEQLVCHSGDDGERGRDRALVVLKPFETVVALRSDQKWIFWGEERIREKLTISFDGKNVFYDRVRVPKK
jgi:hypothetical protein